MTNVTTLSAPPRTVLITGATHRLGAAISQLLAHNGWQIILHARAANSQTEAFSRELKDTTGQATWCVYGDLAATHAIDTLFATAMTHCQTLDAVINNAAIFERQSVTNASVDAYQRHWCVNTLAPIQLTNLLYRHLCQTQRYGTVINLLDQRIGRNDPQAAPYLLSKQALANYTANAALGMAPRLRVNAVAPGAILPPSHPHASEAAGAFPLTRPTPAMVAEAVLSLLAAPAITGQTLFVDAGQHLL